MNQKVSRKMRVLKIFHHQHPTLHCQHPTKSFGLEKMKLSGTHLHLLNEDIEFTMSFVQDCTLLHHQKSILLRMLFRFFSVTILVRKYCCAQTCKVDGLLHNGMPYKKKFLAFVGILLLAEIEKNCNLDTWQLFLDPKQNPIYKATFGVNRFENIRHL